MNVPFFDYEGRVVSLLGRIDAPEINVLADQLLRLDTENDDPITLYVSSIGGDLVDALKIVDVMTNMTSSVTAVAMGLIQSAGVLIFASAAERLILPNALLSTAELWTVPGLESSPRTGFGVPSGQPRELLMAQLEDQVSALKPPSLCRLVRGAATTVRLFTAEQAIAIDLADGMVSSRNRTEISKAKSFVHVRK